LPKELELEVMEAAYSKTLWQGLKKVNKPGTVGG
jgi:hypothetical protein